MGLKVSSLNFTLNSKKLSSVMGENGVAVVDLDEQSRSNNGNLVKIPLVNEKSDNSDENTRHFENIYDSSCEQNCNENLVIDTAIVNDGIGKHINVHSQDDIMIEPESESKRCKMRSKRKSQWMLRFSCARLKGGSSSSGCLVSAILNKDAPDLCVCTGYRKTENSTSKLEGVTAAVPIFVANPNLEPLLKKSPSATLEQNGESSRIDNSNTCPVVEPVIDLSKFNPEDYPIEDCDERARLERAREIAEGVDPPPGFSTKQIELVAQADMNMDSLKDLFHSALSLSALSQIDVPKSVHSQIDYIHCLVPDLLQITSCSFYWGKMDRYEAERLLENKPEGTFLLRDSAQEEYLFSVSFRKYGRSLHARIEQWNHRFSFDSHDPGVFASPTVCGLIEHYKDPSCCMFFEPMLTIPLHRNFAFSLQHLCRTVICDHLLSYDSIAYLKLPKTLKAYLKEYHYKQRVRVRKFDSEL